MKPIRTSIVTLVLGLFIISTNNVFGQLMINEVCASNSNTLFDEDGEANDWIEIYNTTNTEIPLAGWGLSDKNNPNPKWIFQQGVVPAHGYFIVFASDKNRQSATRPHTNFKISQGEEGVSLYYPSGQMADITDSRFIPTNHTLGRIPDGSSALFHITTPSPGASNNIADVAVDVELVQFSFSRTAGVYSNAFDLYISTDDNHAVIRYTLDGSEPTKFSSIYTSPILIKNNASNDAPLSNINTSDSWKKPRGAVNRANVVRVKAFINDVPVSFCHTHTYFIENDFASRYRFPVFSITTDGNNFFNEEKGIYVTGNGEWPNYTGTGDDWERPVHIEYFVDGQRTYQQDVGARVHGRSSRAYPQKSIRLVADENYGSAMMNYPFFGSDGADSFRRLILRTPDRMFNQSYFVDPLTYEVSKDMNIDAQDYQPVIVFLNGEYWGIHQMRERLDQFYIAKHFNVHPDKVDILDFDRQIAVIEGNMDAWKELETFLLSHDLSNQNDFDHVAANVDIDNLLDYLVVQLFFANNDFPINNQKLWREQKEGAKWRFFYFDGDDSMNERHYNPLAYYLSGKNYGDPLSLLFSSLLKNEEFRQQFGARFVYHISTTFEPSRVVEMVREFEQDYLPMVGEHIQRWNSPDNFHEWQRAVQDIKYFAVQRCAELTQQLQSLMADPFTVFPNPSNDVINVKLNDTDFGNAKDFYLSAKVQNVLGKEMTPEIVASGGGVVTIDVSHLPEGVYLLYIKTGRISYIKRVVKS